MKQLVAKFLFAPLIVLLLFAIFFQEMMVAMISKNFAYIDEVLLVCSFVLILFPLAKDTQYTKMVFGLYVMVVVFFLASFNSYAFRSELTILMQISMHFKGFFVFLLLYNFREHINFRPILHAFLVLSIAGILFNMLMGKQFNHMIGAEVTHRFGFVRPVGIQGSTMNLGNTIAFMYLFYMFYKPMESYVRNLPISIGFAFLCLFSSLRTPFVALGVSFLFIFGKSLKRWIIGAVVLAALVPFFMNEYVEELIFMTVENFVNDPTESDYIRGIMIYFSVILAAKYFPFGTGAASYGTFLSDNSPVYREIGMSTTYWFQTKWGIYDSNIASMLGEFGVFGLAIFIFFFYQMIKLIYSQGATRAFCVTFFLMVLAYSLVAPIFMTSYPSMLLALVMVSAIPKNQSEVAEESETQTQVATTLSQVEKAQLEQEAQQQR